jgi:hypothetical protein
VEVVFGVVSVRGDCVPAEAGGEGADVGACGGVEEDGGWGAGEAEIEEAV